MADESVFDEVPPDHAASIHRRLLAGECMADIRRTFPNVTAKLMRAMRDEVFEPLLNDPEAVKALAAGPVLNALEIVRYRRRPGRPARTARPGPVQTEMFPA